MKAVTRRTVLTAAMAAMLGPPLGARTQSLTPLKVMVFAGISNLPLFAAQSQGYFQKRGLNVELLNAHNSDELRGGLADGHHQLAHAGVDNAIAMSDVSKVDIAVVIGGHGGFGQIFVQPDIEALKDVRGKAVVVDAPNTAYALVLYKLLESNGLKRGDYSVNPAGGTTLMLAALLRDKNNAAAIISPPFAFSAERNGLKSLGPAKTAIGAYQFDAGFVLRAWARENPDKLVRYLQAYIEGCRWSLDPANKASSVRLIADRLKLTPDDAARTYEIVIDPANGIARDARLDREGFKTTLKLRADIEGQWGGNPPSPDRYIDETYYNRALRGLQKS